MDRMKLVAQAVITAGLAFAFPGPQVLEWLQTPDPSFTVVQPTDPATAGSENLPPKPFQGAVDPADAPTPRAWFQSVRPHCNAVEAATWLGANPAPVHFEGYAYTAACYALAGRIDDARDYIDRMSGDERWRAAGIVFDVGHPAADAGDNVAAGPLMELVVEFWPNHYQALYHAGAARYEQGDRDGTLRYLQAFLRHYDQDDGWTRSAKAMLAEAAQG